MAVPVPYVIASVAGLLAVIFFTLWRSATAAQFIPAFERAPAAAALEDATLQTCGTDPRRVTIPGATETAACVFSGLFVPTQTIGAPLPNSFAMLESDVVARCIADPACVGYVVTRAAPATACPPASTSTINGVTTTINCASNCVMYPDNNGAPMFRLLASVAKLEPVHATHATAIWHTTTTTTYVRQF